MLAAAVAMYRGGRTDRDAVGTAVSVARRLSPRPVDRAGLNINKFTDKYFSTSHQDNTVFDLTYILFVCS